jgi:hypothetical protein
MHPRRLEKNANITLKIGAAPPGGFHIVGEKRPDGSNYGADVMMDVISYIVSPIVSSGGKEKARFASSDLSARRGENSVLGPKKLNSPQA